MKKMITFALSSLLVSCFGDSSMLTTRGIIASDWAKTPDPYCPDPVYCYKTLGGVDCYDQKIPGLESRLVAFYPLRPSGVLVQERKRDQPSPNTPRENQFYYPPQNLITGQEKVSSQQKVIKVERLENKSPLTKQ